MISGSSLSFGRRIDCNAPGNPDELGMQCALGFLPTIVYHCEVSDPPSTGRGRRFCHPDRRLLK